MAIYSSVVSKFNKFKIFKGSKVPGLNWAKGSLAEIYSSAYMVKGHTSYKAIVC